jgi:hypothetical protein
MAWTRSDGRVGGSARWEDRTRGWAQRFSGGRIRESDRSFLKLAPIVAVVTNIDREHLDCYSSLDDIRTSFIEFVNKVPFYGAAILCLDDANVQGIIPFVKRRTITYGNSAQADLEISEAVCERASSNFRLRFDNELGTFCLRVPGEHNVLNATAPSPLPSSSIRSSIRYAKRCYFSGRPPVQVPASSAASPWSTTTVIIRPRSGPRWNRRVWAGTADPGAVPTAPLCAHTIPDG